MLFRSSRLIPVVAAVACLGAQAATHQVDLQLDARALRPGLLSGPTVADPITLAVGDRLDVEIRFQPGQTLALGQALSFSLLTPATDIAASIDFQLDNTLTLRGTDGAVLYQGRVTQSPNGNALQSLFFASDLGLPMGASLTLSGLSFTTTVLSYGDGAAAHTFAGPQLSILAGSVVAGVSPVPEPGRFGLALAGLFMLGLWCARRQQQPASR